MDLKDIKDAVIYFSFTSKEDCNYAYLYLIVNGVFYFIDENYNEAEPVSESTLAGYIREIENDSYETVYDLEDYETLEDLLKAIGQDKKESIEIECEEDGCWDYLSKTGEYTVSAFIGQDKIAEVIV